MVLKMEDKELIRRLVSVQGLSQREVNRRFGWSRDSIADAIRNPEPNTYMNSKNRIPPSYALLSFWEIATALGLPLLHQKLCSVLAKYRG